MGLFSFNCRKCGHPLISEYYIRDKNKWMMIGVALDKTGPIAIGQYDGYGTIMNNPKLCEQNNITTFSEEFAVNDLESDLEGNLLDIDLYHYDCWLLKNKPEFIGPSERSECQGGMYLECASEHNQSFPPEYSSKITEFTEFSDEEFDEDN